MRRIFFRIAAGLLSIAFAGVLFFGDVGEAPLRKQIMMSCVTVAFFCTPSLEKALPNRSWPLLLATNQKTRRRQRRP